VTLNRETDRFEAFGLIMLSELCRREKDRLRDHDGDNGDFGGFELMRLTEI
jgi:hypothetical protein